MNFKKFIAGLTTQQVMAFASQNGFREWRTKDQRSMVSYLNQSEEAKEVFRRVYGT